MATACRVVPDGIVLAVRLTPKAARATIDGLGRLSDGSEVVIARVRALPAEGAANAALVALLAKALGVPKSAIAIVAGGGARLKRVHIEGDAAALSAIVERWPRPS